MTPIALKRDRLRTMSSVANGRNHRRRTSPTLWPSLRRRRIATFIGRASVPWPKNTNSASSVMYSSRNGLSPPRPKSFLKSACASRMTVSALRIAWSFCMRISMSQSWSTCGAIVMGLSGWSSRSPRSKGGRNLSTAAWVGIFTICCEWVRNAPSSPIATGSDTRLSSPTRHAMSARSSASCAVSAHGRSQPRSRTASESLCSVPNAPGSSSARLPQIATTGSRRLAGSGGPYLGVRRNPALFLEPFVVAVVVLLPELPLVVVVFELELVDHDDAVLDRADLGTDPATDAGFVDHLVVAFGRDLEALVRTVEPAHRALDARVEVHDRAERARRVFLVLRVAFAGLAGVDDDAGAHCGPARFLELEHLVAARALARLHCAELRAVKAVLRGLHGAFVFGLFFDERLHILEADPVRHDLRECAQDAVVGMVILEDPETGERRAARNDDERGRPLGRIGLRKHLGRRVLAGDEEETFLAQRLPDRLTAVPGPRLDTLDERVVDGDRHVDDGRPVLRHRRLDLEIVDRDDRGLLGRHAVALRGVAVARERGAGVAALARGEHD